MSRKQHKVSSQNLTLTVFKIKIRSDSPTHRAWETSFKPLKLGTCLNKMLAKFEGSLNVINRSDEGLTIETSAFLPFTVVNLGF